MTTSAKQKIDDYQLQGLIAPGGTSAVFDAYRNMPQLQKPWRVALKFVWKIEAAREEAQSLVALENVRGVVQLLDYFEVPFADIRPFILDLNREEWGRSVVRGAVAERKDEDMIGCLVLQFLAGLPLIQSTQPISDNKHIENRKEKLIVKDIESGIWLQQQLTTPLSIKEKLNIITQITEHIVDCHKRGIVHADLKPQNILYQKESGQVTIVDFGGSGTRGSPGWQGPEHFQQNVQGGGNYTTALDVFLIGLFINRFFEDEKQKDLLKLADLCFKEPDQRITAAKLLSELKRIEREKFGPGKDRKIVPLIINSLLVAALFTLWWTRDREPSLEERFGADNGRAFVQEKVETAATDARHRYQAAQAFRDLLDTSGKWPEFESQLIGGLAQLQKINQLPLVENLDQFRPEAVRMLWYDPEGHSFMLYQDQWLEVGEWLTPSLYFADIRFPSNHEARVKDPRLYLVCSDLENQEVVALPPFEHLFVFNSNRKIFIYDGSLRDILRLAAPLSSRQIRGASADVEARGVLSFQDGEHLLRQLAAAIGAELTEEAVIIPPITADYLYFESLGYINGSMYNLTEFIEKMARSTGYTWTDPEGRELVRDLSVDYLYHDPEVLLPWQEALNRVLESHQLHFQIQGKAIFIQKNSGKPSQAASSQKGEPQKNRP